MRGKARRRFFYRLILGWLALALAVTSAGGAPLRLVKSADSAGAPYLVICADELCAALDGFAALKAAQNYTVQLLPLSQIGADPQPAQIKAAIQTIYAASGLSALLLVGSADLLPAGENSEGTFLTDLYYAALDGSTDYQANLPYGRLPAETPAEVAAYIARLRAYQQAPAELLDLTRAALIAGQNGADWAAWEGALDDAGNRLTGAGYTISALYAHRDGAQGADVLSELEQNPAGMIYAGPGQISGWTDPVLSAAQIAAAEQGSTAFVLSLADYTAALAEPAAFARQWVLNDSAGALTYIGAASASVWTNQDSLLLEFFTQALTETENGAPRQATLGAVWQETLRLFNESVLSVPVRRAAAELYQLYGDPTLPNPFSLWKTPFEMQADPQRVSVCRGQSAALTVQLTTFSPGAAASFSLSGLPAGVQAQFSPAQVNAPGATQLTLHAEADAAPSADWLEVQAATPAQTFVRQARIWLQVAAAPPAAVWPLAPVSAVRDAALRPVLRWSPAAQAAAYRLELDDDPDFSSPLFSLDGLTQPEYTLAQDLPPATRIYWRVQALNGCGAGAYSPAAVFYTRSLNQTCATGDSLLALDESDLPDFTGWEAQAGWTSGSAVIAGTERAIYTAAPQAGTALALTSAPLSLPDDLRHITLSLPLSYDLGSAAPQLTGALLEIRAAGEENWQVLSADQLLQTPYTHLLLATYGNPLGGHMAWSGQSTDWQTAVADLSAFAGQTIQMRLRLGAGDSLPAGSPYFSVAAPRLQGCSGPADQAAQFSGLPEARAILPPNQASAVDFSVTNLAQAGYYTLSVTPPDWQAAVSPESFYLAQGETRPARLMFNPSAGVPAGERRQFTLTLSSQSDAAAWQAAQLEAETELAQFSAGLTAGGGTGSPAAWLPLQVRLYNSGNVSLTLQLSVQSAGGWRLSNPSAALTLSPGAQADWNGAVQIPAAARPGQSERIEIQISAADYPQVTQTLSAQAQAVGMALFLPYLCR